MTLGLAVGYSPSAEGFRLQRLGGPVNLNISRREIAQDGSRLTSAAEQTFAMTSQNLNVPTFSQPITVGLGGLVPGAISADDSRRRFLRIRLTRAERRQCLTHRDFDIRLRVDSAANTLTSVTGGGGFVEVLDFETVPLFGRRCRPSLWFGYRVRLGLDEAIADNGYRGTLEIEARLLRPGGGVSRLTTPIAADIPQVLLLYHPQRVQLNLQASAFAPLLSGATNKCSGDLCQNLGAAKLVTNSLVADAAIPGGSAFAFGNQELQLRDVVAVRALGCQGGIYGSATYRVTNTVGPIEANSGEINGIQGQPCGMDIRTGDIDITLDLNDPNNTSRDARGDIQITVTGL